MRRLNKPTIAVVAVALALVAIVLINVIKARNTRASNACINNLRQLDEAKQQWALENQKATNAVPVWTDVLPYLRGMPRCPDGGTYVLGSVGEVPRCSLGGSEHTLRQ